MLTSLLVLHTPSRTYLDPWSGNLFAEGGVEQDLLRAGPPGGRVQGVDGGVIMPKLGNETAKSVRAACLWFISDVGCG